MRGATASYLLYVALAPKVLAGLPLASPRCGGCPAPLNRKEGKHRSEPKVQHANRRRGSRVPSEASRGSRADTDGLHEAAAEGAGGNAQRGGRPRRDVFVLVRTAVSRMAYLIRELGHHCNQAVYALNRLAFYAGGVA